MIDFKKFKRPIALQFQAMVNHGQLFRVSVTKERMWETYLNSYPEGTNVLFRKQREYECSCCRQFISIMGAVVGINNSELISIWDTQCEDPVYQQVADAMSALIKSCPIDNVFLHTEHHAGVDKNHEHALGEDVLTWNHFFVNLDNRVVKRGQDIGPCLSDMRATHDVLKRGLEEITFEALDTVLDLIRQGSLYKGPEHDLNLQRFLYLKQQFVEKGPRQDNFVWYHTGQSSKSVTRLRNTSIGTLLTDLSTDVDVEAAVRKYEKMVAPENYQRPTALVTPRMIADAKQTLTDLGLLSALSRRYARLSDISTADILFADRAIVKSLQGEDVFSNITTKVTLTAKSFEHVETVSLGDFLANIVPRCTSIEVFFDKVHSNRLVSLITAEDPTSLHLFKWPNHFSWSYTGDFTDSIKERVKQAGGSVTGDLCCRLSWNNFDDLDLHMREPQNYEIYFSNKGHLSPSGGMLDVDMNAGGPNTRTPVENIVYKNQRAMRQGVYTLFVRQFRARESIDVGFNVEIDCGGDVHLIEYPQAVRQDQDVTVAVFSYSVTDGLKVVSSLASKPTKRNIWGLDTNEFHRVNLICWSPNYWKTKLGNQHCFFMLDGCRNEGKARGFYNEFLTTELNRHRKVIEMVGAKMRTDEDREQLSGLGFSVSQNGELIVRVKGALTRTLKVII
jgi:hypothetical protein